MNSNEGQPAETETKDRYEATVLDFLDREMAMVQETQKKNQQADELDALVSDLLKQVITEADQKIAPEDKPLFDQDELFSGLTPGQKAVGATGTSNPSPTLEKPASTAPIKPETQPVSRVDAQVSTPKPERAVEAKAVAEAPAALFSPGTAPAKKFPFIAAAAGILVMLGAAGYFFFASSTDTPSVSEPAAVAQSAGSETPPEPAPVQTSATPSPQPQKPAIPAAKDQAAGRAASAKASTPQTSHQPAKPAAGNMTQPAPVTKTPIEEKVFDQPVSVAPMPVQIAATIEKPSSPVTIENSSPATPERRPAAPAQTAAASEPPAVPVSSPAPSAASAANRLIPSVPLVQTSPVFPELAVRAKASGSVVLELQIDDQGKVVKATPVSGPAIFHNAAVTAVMKWRYKPASLGGVNVSSQSRVTMVFNLKK